MADDQHDGSDSPGDSGHGEEAAQLVAQQAFEHLPHEFGQVGHIALLQDDLLAFVQAFGELRFLRRC